MPFNTAVAVRAALLLLLLLLLLGLAEAGTASEPGVKLNDEDINFWVNSLSGDFEAIRQKLGIETFEADFEANGVTSDVIDEAKGVQLMEKIKSRIEHFLFKNEEHVERIRTEAETSFSNHVFRNFTPNCIELKNRPFLRSTAVNKISVAPLHSSHEAAHGTANASHTPDGQSVPATITVAPMVESAENYCSAPTGLELQRDPRVYNVDTNRRVSTAHVPANIYAASTEILNVANWSTALDSVFISNAESDAMLKWQYFGNIEGVFKIYPGIRWYIQTRELSNKDTTIDFFDCRTQYWYLLAANYPKDMVILLDNSGSMKGRRAIIANMTLTELLYTLNVNDFFNVILFMNSSLKYLSDSHNFTMMQATEKNKYTVMDLIQDDEERPVIDRHFAPFGISDYQEALQEAFQLLKYVKTNATGLSSGGVQVIVLISDGAPQVFAELFQQYNADRQVRVFTFLVGHEAAEEDNVKRIACSNRGYFVQISTLSDVKENVQRYVPVVARTNAHMRDHFFVWTGVHRNQIKTQNPNAARVSHSAAEAGAETATPAAAAAAATGSAGYTVFPLSDAASSAAATTTTTTAVPTAQSATNATAAPRTTERPRIVYKTRMDRGPHVIQEEDPAVKNRLFISVAQSAYDIRDNETIHRGIGRLIGVAGLDVPTDHLERLGPAWEVGAMAYTYMVTNNGHVLFHPDFRPFDNEGNLRLFYNNRDIAEIEYPSEDQPLYNAPSYLLPLRLSLIQRETGIQEINRTKTLEDFSRGYRQTFKHFYAPLNATSASSGATRPTPFSLGLALPWREGRQWPQPLAYKRAVQSHDLSEADLIRVSGRLFNSSCQPVGLTVYLAGLVDYEFCELTGDLLAEYGVNPVCALGEVLQQSRANQTAMRCSIEYLDRVYTDALSTQAALGIWQAIDNATLLSTGASLFFLWTGSGFSRWCNRTAPLQPDFIASQRNGSREAVYEKTVQLSAESDAPISVLTVPSSRQVLSNLKSNATYPRAFPVYLTSAIRTRGPAGSRAPIGIAGVELDYARLEEAFLRVTNSCADASTAGCVSCGQLNVRCYLLDRAGFVAMSEARQDVGKAFDQVDCTAMRTLVAKNLFESMQAYDYQAICARRRIIAGGASPRLSNPIGALLRLASWLLLEGFLFLSDVSGSIFQALSSAAQDAVVSLTGSFPPLKMLPEECAEVESAKPRQLLELRERIDARVADVLETLKSKTLPAEKTAEVKRSLVQPFCIATQGRSQEACVHLCRRLKQKMEISIYADLMGNCPKQVVKHVDCVLRRDLVRWTGQVPVDGPSGHVVSRCADHGFCASEGCPETASSNLYVRPVPRTNLVFVAAAGDPNCGCLGCADTVGRTELVAGPANYSAPRAPRAEPPWGLKSIVLQDNATICHKLGSSATSTTPAVATIALAAVLAVAAVSRSFDAAAAQ